MRSNKQSQKAASGPGQRCKSPPGDAGTYSQKCLNLDLVDARIS